MRLTTIAAGLGAALLGLGVLGAASASTLIVGARLVDGTGAAPRTASVRIDGDRIVAVGQLRRRASDTVVDARGLVLAPGFIDVHSHHDVGGFADRAMAPLLAQGVTTVVVGQDGARLYGAAHIAGLFAKAPPSVNAASYTGHGFVRSGAMGEDYKRHSTPSEVAKMQALLQTDLDAGSLGLSTGLEYDPGIYSDTAEIIALARTAAVVGGRYISHMRSEDVAFDAALDELLEIGRVTGIPVQATHLKLAIVDRWGQAPAVLAKLDKARAEGVNVTADVYPYEYWQSSLTVLFPKRDFTDRAAAAFALTSLSTPQGMLIAEYAPDPSLVGKTIAQIAAARGASPPDTYLALIRDAQAYARDNPGVTRLESVIGTSMAAKDVADFTAWPFSSISSDGLMQGLHPRGKGAFAKVLRLYVREEKRLTLAEAVRKMTSLAADSVGLTDRGVVRPGAFADLVLFDPATITDNATNAHPEALASGVSRVWVNGASVFENGRPTDVHAGRFLKRAGAR